MFPTKLNGITDMNTTTILSSVAEGASADKLPAIGSLGGLCSTLFTHRPVNFSLH